MSFPAYRPSFFLVLALALRGWNGKGERASAGAQMAKAAGEQDRRTSTPWLSGYLKVCVCCAVQNSSQSKSKEVVGP
ncbi:uncharacterized protein IWZ02DRAFT_149400 [Phyllosticta citriasiana]|uniref:uncharacterized protein n=1 Tax=Phyllosticta citriasiana TaxID=595635 RepID=UPI0030FD9ECE